MYLFLITAFLFVLPCASIGMEAWLGGVPSWLALIAKWFVFWAVGVRLFLAGVRQMVQPAYTARVVLSLKGEESLFVVRELGMANTSIGLAGLVSLALPAWRPAGALAGGVFYLLAGIHHARTKGRGRLQNVAMGSDLFVGILLLSVLAAMPWA
jgi:hypothetical protein